MDFRSPIEALLSNVAASPFKLAPERAEELVQLRDSLGLRLHVSGEDSFDFFASILMKRIFTTLTSFERLWAAAYYYLILYDSYVSSPAGSVILVHGDAERQEAQNLYLAAREADRIRGEFTWPVGAPSPSSGHRLSATANELFLTMCGFILLHEAGHIVLDHLQQPDTPLEQVRAQEFEADAWAYNWILERWEQYDRDQRVFGKRSMGVAFSLSYIGGLELLHPAKEPRTHPSSVQRLRRFFRDYKEVIHSGPYLGSSISAAACGLHVHLVQEGRKIESVRVYGDIFEYLDSIEPFFEMGAANTADREDV